MRSNCSTTFEWEEKNAIFEVRGFISKYFPAKISGPPENCYPAEGGELEDWAIECVGSANGRPMTNREKIQAESDLDHQMQLGEKIFEQIQEQLFDDAIARSEPDPDYLYDRRKDEP